MQKKYVLMIFFTVLGISSLIIYRRTGSSICLFYNFYGVPCPTCGMTRAYSYLLDGDIKRAFKYHPLFFLVPVLILSFIKKKLFYMLSILFFLVWIIRMCLFFPVKEPLTFNKEAFVPRIYNSVFNWK